MTTTTFGHRLKELRRARGLNQSQVGFGRYSASYVSLLERGLRKPSPTVVQFLSTQLGVEADQFLNGGTSYDYSDTHPGLTVLELGSRSAWLERDYETALGLARQAAKIARATGRTDTWWSAMHLEAMSLVSLERYDECHELAVELSHHPVATESPELMVDILTLATRAARAAGRLAIALDHVNAAREPAEGLPASSPVRLQRWLAEIAVLADLRDLDAAKQAGVAIRALRDHVESAHLRGLSAWAVGNLAFLTGDSEAGLEEHNRARLLIKPEADLRAWGRFHKASARMRVAAGDNDVKDLVAAASHALELAGNDSDRHELTLVRAELALSEGNLGDALALVEVEVGGSLPPNVRAEAAMLRHRCLQQLGRYDDARATLAKAAVLFEESGALQRAVETWRLYAGLPRDEDPDEGSHPRTA